MQARFHLFVFDFVFISQGGLFEEAYGLLLRCMNGSILAQK
ncbi:hypothetical protein A33Q_3272 [Indibacter alkaliphilus LW1]|uniref:Uncharacterized protein n=1 Tax=Indibacter alkaliphilus (strain CCUG 57479 / KCTC 22604 / LW1) TaxID=1189612 RepID=S2D808_INDAL|nr:hypothetical protein A33Q_3272 [Indibacter alkaliphilus LW1]